MPTSLDVSCPCPCSDRILCPDVFDLWHAPSISTTYHATANFEPELSSQVLDGLTKAVCTSALKAISTNTFLPGSDNVTSPANPYGIVYTCNPPAAVRRC